MLSSIEKNDVGPEEAKCPARKPTEPHPETPVPELERRLEICWPADEWRDTHVLLAVSGGADSIALLRAILAIKSNVGGTGKLFVGHLNHGLRGSDADADTGWLEKLCNHLGVPFETATVDVASLAADNGDGIEAAARFARYEFLRQTAERIGARYVATGHTADDQVETALHRIIRGTGLAGLAGIQRCRPLSPSVTLVRPMLTICRREITDYLSELVQDFRSDASNDDLRHTRNRLRHELLPILRERFNANVDCVLTQLATQAQEAQQYIESTADAIVNECVDIDFSTGGPGRCGRQIVVYCSRLASQRSIIVREVLKRAWIAANWPQQSMGYAEWQLLADLAAANCPKSIANLPSNIQARRKGDLLYLTSPGLA